MASKQEFPVRVSKGTGDNKVTRTAHSPIALAQLQTEGFKIEGERRTASPQKQAEKPAEQKQAEKPAEQRPAEKSADKSADQK